MDDPEVLILLRHGDAKNPHVREAMKRLLPRLSPIVATELRTKIAKAENPCNRCGGLGYLSRSGDEWGVPLAERPRCPYCNGRGHGRDR